MGDFRNFQAKLGVDFDFLKLYLNCLCRCLVFSHIRECFTFHVRYFYTIYHYIIMT